MPRTTTRTVSARISLEQYGVICQIAGKNNMNVQDYIAQKIFSTATDNVYSDLKKRFEYIDSERAKYYNKWNELTLFSDNLKKKYDTLEKELKTLQGLNTTALSTITGLKANIAEHLEALRLTINQKSRIQEDRDTCFARIRRYKVIFGLLKGVFHVYQGKKGIANKQVQKACEILNDRELEDIAFSEVKL